MIAFRVTDKQSVQAAPAWRTSRIPVGTHGSKSTKMTSASTDHSREGS